MTDEQAYIERLQPDYREPERSEGSLERVVRCDQCQWAEDKDGINVVCKYPRERPAKVVDMSSEIRGRIRTGVFAANYCNHFAPNDPDQRPKRIKP